MGGMLVSIRDLTLRLPSGGRTLTVLDGVSLDVDAREAGAVARAPGSGQPRLRDRRRHHRPPLRAESRPRHDAAARHPRRSPRRARRSRGVAARRPHRRRAPPRRRAGPVSAAPRLAWRQARGAWRHFVLLAACVALGVAALVAVGSFAATLDHTLAREAKALTGGDLEVRAARPLDGEAAAALADLRAKGASIVSVRELLAMARGADGRALLVELKAPGAGYPLYGRLETAPAAPLAALLADGGAVVQGQALERLGLRVGDRPAPGAATLTVRGVAGRRPDPPANLRTPGPRRFRARGAGRR